jgi:uncharacterized membrane protein YeaQ/YmgE (transglycosylase-associated protein family)
MLDRRPQVTTTSAGRIVPLSPGCVCTRNHRKDIAMGFFGFLLLGLIAGAIAKLILPGKQGGGWFITLLLGVVGALLGGWLGGLIFNAPLQDFFSIQTWLLAIGGSIIVLLIYGLIVNRKRKA